MVTLEQVHEVIGSSLPPITFSFDKRDTALYALGVGAPADWLNPDELRFVYELHHEFAALPTMPVIYGGKMIDAIISGDIQGIKFNPMMLVHGEQALEIRQALPVEGTIHCTPIIRNIFDKGSGMLLITDVECADESGTVIAVATSSMFIRGLGGFGGERGSSEKIEIPDRQPDFVHVEPTSTRQALIYRLSGDINPLHADPSMAQVGNFEKPILHGLATYGFAGRAILKHFCKNDPQKFKAISARFVREVYPGDTLTTEMWETADGILFQTRVIERDVVVLSNAKAIIG